MLNRWIIGPVDRLDCPYVLCELYHCSLDNFVLPKFCDRDLYTLQSTSTSTSARPNPTQIATREGGWGLGTNDFRLAQILPDAQHLVSYCDRHGTGGETRTEAISSHRHQLRRQVYMWPMCCICVFAFSSLYTRLVLP